MDNSHALAAKKWLRQPLRDAIISRLQEAETHSTKPKLTPQTPSSTRSVPFPCYFRFVYTPYSSRFSYFSKDRHSFFPFSLLSKDHQLPLLTLAEP